MRNKLLFLALPLLFGLQVMPQQRGKPANYIFASINEKYRVTLQ